jgi:hypothetical protein
VFVDVYLTSSRNASKRCLEEDFGQSALNSPTRLNENDMTRGGNNRRDHKVQSCQGSIQIARIMNRCVSFNRVRFNGEFGVPRAVLSK